MLVPSTPPAVPTTTQEFRAVQPAFASQSVFPDASIAFWISVANALLNAERWADMLGTAVVLFASHNLALEALATKRDSGGGVPGLSTGIISGESAESASVSYDTAGALQPDAGHWNLTDYGKRFVWLQRMFGAGPLQVGTGPCTSGSFFVVGAYQGPMVGPGWWQ